MEKNGNNGVAYDPKIVGANFRKLRNESGWGQEKLAIELGYSNNSQLSEFETGKGMLPMNKLQSAAELIGVPVDMILKPKKELTDEQVQAIMLFSKKILNQGTDFKHYRSVIALLKEE